MKTEMKSNTAPMNLSVVGAVLFHILDRKVEKNEKNAYFCRRNGGTVPVSDRIGTVR